LRGRISDPGSFSPEELTDLTADLAFEITCRRNLVPGRPARRYKRETKGPGGPLQDRKPGQSARLTPRTVIRFWPMPTSP
jgi:hypothetical protein